MNENDLKEIDKRFRSYTGAFVAAADDDRPYTLKQGHTMAVVRHITLLAESLGLAPDAVRLARGAALVHDLGRFPQFHRFGTFSDTRSRNHAALGAGTLVRQGILAGLARDDRRLILRAVALHNRPRLPGGLSPELDRLSRLLRDADKIDIYQVMAALYRSPENGSENFITHDLIDDGRVSVAFVNRLRVDRPILYSEVRTLNDMKLFQVSMIQDLNFPAAFRAVREMAAVDAILGSMPDSPALHGLAAILNARLDRAAVLPVCTSS